MFSHDRIAVHNELPAALNRFSRFRRPKIDNSLQSGPQARDRLGQKSNKVRTKLAKRGYTLLAGYIAPILKFVSRKSRSVSWTSGAETRLHSRHAFEITPAGIRVVR